MGKLSYDASIRHFSHDHPLELSNLQNRNSNLSPCSGCKTQLSGWVYTCKSCNYVLHISCSQMPKLITHSAHQTHPLTLLARPAYPEGLFNCDACGSHGDGFSYHCATCGLDFHILCASAPLALNHHSHPHHPLKLAFSPPYQTKGFNCDVCHKLGSNHWLYRCSECEFDAHLGCARGELPGREHFQVQNQIQPPQLLQHNHSFPGAYHPHQCYNYVNGVSMGVPQTALPVQNGMGMMYAVQPSVQPTQNSLMSVAIQGIVEGAAQQVGQNLVQSIIGGSSSGGGSSVSVLDLGSSVLGGMFGDSSSSNGETS